jgi:hypothetical protein
MQQPLSVDHAKLLADAHHNKDANGMHAPLLMLEIQANALEHERRNQQLMNDQLRLARLQRRNAARGALVAVRHMIGAMLIHVGERLNPEPARGSDNANTAMNA